MFEGYFANETSKKVAIKILKPIDIDKIRREISILRRLDHPNIIKLHDVIINPSTRFPALVMEHVDKGISNWLMDSLGHSDVQLYVF